MSFVFGFLVIVVFFFFLDKPQIMSVSKQHLVRAYFEGLRPMPRQNRHIYQ